MDVSSLSSSSDLFCENMKHQYKWKQIIPNHHSSSSLPRPRSGATTCVVNQSMYVFGGHDGRQGTYFNDVWEYQFDNNIWREIIPGATRKEKEVSMSLDTALECRGGERYRELFSTQFNLNESSHPAPEISNIKEEEIKVVLPNSRTDHSLVEWNKKLIAFGGFDGAHRWNDVFMFDIETEMWTKLSGESNKSINKIEPSPRFGHSAIVYEDKMWIYGGWDGKNTLDDLWCFDLINRTWCEIPYSSTIRPSSISPVINRNGNNHGVPSATSPMHTFFSRKASPSVCNGELTRTDPQPSFSIASKDYSPKYLIQTSPTPSPCAKMHSPSAQMSQKQQGKNIGDVTNTLSESRILSRSCDITDCDQLEHNTTNYFTDDSEEECNNDDMVESSSFDISSGERPTHRYRHLAMVLNDCMYVFGGVDKSQKRFNDLTKLDFQTLRWEKVSCLGCPPSERTFHASVMIDSILYVTGGFDGNERLNDSFIVNLGPLSPPSLSEICARYLRKNYEEVSKKDSFERIPNEILESLIWTRSGNDDKIRGGIVLNKESKEKATIIVCDGLSLDERRPFLSEEENISIEVTRQQCNRCGRPANEHELIENKSVLAILEGHKHKLNENKDVGDSNSLSPMTSLKSILGSPPKPQ